MAEKYSTSVQIDVSAQDKGNSVKSIKTELREAKAEAIAMARAFGDGSKEATLAATKVAKLKDEVEDLGIRMQGVNPDKFSRIASIGQGVAQGFVAAQGAMALFGSESKDLEKTMVKLQGAIALSQGLQGLKDLQLALSGINIYVKAFAVALTLVVSYWREFSEAVKSIFPQFQKVIDFFNNFKQIAAGTINAVKAMFSDLGSGIVKLFKGQFKEALIEFGKIGADMATSFNEAYDKKDKEIKLQNGIKERQFMIAMLEAQGKDVLALRLKLQRDELTLLEKGSDEYKAKLIEIERTKKAILDKQIQDAKEREAAKQKAFDEAQKRIIADDKANLEAQKLTDEERAKWNATQRQLALDEEAKLQAEVAKLQAKADAEQKMRDEGEVAAFKAVQDAKLEVLFAGLSAMSALVEGNEKLTNALFIAEKAAAIAKIVINTIAEISAINLKWAAVPGGLPFALAESRAAKLRAASGIITIVGTTITKFKSGGNATIPANAAGNYQAPTISQTPAQQRELTQTSTGATGIGRQSNEVKVIVTETDITRVQNRAKGLERRARVL